MLRILFLLALCGALGQNLASGEERRLLACSTTQVADFARQVVGDRWEVRSVLGAGQDPHLYEITQGDSELVAKAALCAENGWHLEGKDWMKRLATTAGKPIVTCTDGIPPLELEEGGEKVRDPHAWFTPSNAAIYVRNITRAVSEVDPVNKDEYAARAELYLAQLRTLDQWIRSQLRVLPKEQRVLVTSHDAFNYFCRAYDFSARTPTGWSTGDEVGGGATEARRRETLKAIRESGIKAIFVETSVNEKVVRTLADETGVRIGGKLYSDSMGPPGSAGETYLGMMRENVLTIVEALR